MPAWPVLIEMSIEAVNRAAANRCPNESLTWFSGFVSYIAKTLTALAVHRRGQGQIFLPFIFVNFAVLLLCYFCDGVLIARE